MHNDVQIPKKSFFKQDEVCSITGVKPYVLRFWETEFEEISPVVSMTGQKLYEHKDIEAILKIKTLLFDQKLSVDKARQLLKNPPEVLIGETSSELEVVIAAQEEVTVQKPVELVKNFWEEVQNIKGRLQTLQSHLNAIKTRQNWMN